MTQRTWYLDPIRGFLSLIDGVIYDFINKLYQLFAYISQMTLFDDQIFKNFASRIYMILGIVMLFKVAFSLISYLVNPDELTDSKTGIGNVVKRIIISLVLLTFVPTIFTYAFRIQSIIVGDNILGNLILGDAGYNNDPDNANIQTTSSANNTDNSTSLVDNGGKLMAFDVLTAFYYIEPTVVNHNGYCKSEDVANEATDECDYGGDNAFDEDGSEHFNEIFNVPDSPYYHNVKAYLKYANRQVGSDGDVDKKGYYGMHYSVILSTIAGGFTLALLLTFCFDVALRAVKLAVLQLIAPIPILSYIEPKKGEGIMQKWIQESISTYVSLFIRLAILFFIIYFGSLISKNGIKILDSEGNPQNIEEAGYVYSMLAKAFIWMGLLMFAKEAPKLIGDLFGIKSDGFSINPIKKFRDVPLVSGMIGAGVGGIAAAGSNLLVGIDNPDKNKGAIARSTIAGLGSGTVRGAIQAEKNKQPIRGGLAGAAMSSRARNNRADGYGLFQRARNKATDISGRRYEGGTADLIKSEITEMKNAQNTARQNYDSISNSKSALRISSNNAGAYIRLQNQLDEMNKAGQSTINYSYKDYVEDYIKPNIEKIKNDEERIIAEETYDEWLTGFNNGDITEQDFNKGMNEIATKYNFGTLNDKEFENYHQLDNAEREYRNQYEKTTREINKLEEKRELIRGKKKPK